MARKPNYRFDRYERERLKAEKKAKRAAAKEESRKVKSAPSDLSEESAEKPELPITE